eukprot:CAMPEP_0185458846 /NCGR_PEP_ID=MMETSP1365-20130426/83410_1 /TAXON_ID=38817 /ORGANISM="Gephyrocapsa oceanica, Strain RCC1303" /LENGTH=130 /DNA_ID=CAMNT_0028065361 /DNA_START=66 /DNA_END=454 /DNA_ORIENTATION=-
MAAKRAREATARRQTHLRPTSAISAQPPLLDEPREAAALRGLCAGRRRLRLACRSRGWRRGCRQRPARALGLGALLLNFDPPQLTPRHGRQVRAEHHHQQAGDRDRKPRQPAQVAPRLPASSAAAAGEAG